MSRRLDPDFMSSSLPLAVVASRTSGAVIVPHADVLTRYGRVAVGLALVAFGVANLVVGEFVPGRAPAWPVGMPGQFAWAYISGVAIVVAGLCIVSGRWAVRAAYFAAAMIGVWALLRQIPIALDDRQLGGAWTNLGKALALSGGLIGVAGSLLLTAIESTDADVHRGYLLRAVGRCSLGAFLVLAGIQHFLFAPFVATLVPAWIPGQMFWTQFAGVALIAGGIGLVFAVTAQVAATLVGAMLFIWVFVLHIPRGLSMNNQNEWTAVIEAFVFSGIAFALAQRARVRNARR